MKPLLIALAILVGLLPVDGSTYERDHLSQSVVYADASQTHWLTNSSKIRHNKSCQWYHSSKGRPCRKDEGKGL
jgi:hypothetical protein